MAREDNFRIRFGEFISCLTLILMTIVFFNVRLYFLGILFLIFCIALTIWSIYDINESKKPSLISLEESKELNESLEREEVKRYIQYLHKTKNRYIYNIARKVGKRFNINLIFKKGRLTGDLKLGIADKICMILGFKDYLEYLSSYDSKGGFKGRNVLLSKRINKYINLAKVKRRAADFFNLGNYSEALIWYKEELSILTNLGLDTSSDAIKTLERIEYLKEHLDLN